MKLPIFPRRTRWLRDDSGATLIIALAIITTVALVTGAVLSHSFTNLKATVSLRAVAGTSYAADAAAKLAIDNLRLGSNAAEWTTPGFNGTWNDGSWNGWVFTNFSDGTGCFGASGVLPRDDLAFAGVYPRSGRQTADPSARVECTPVPGTGILGGAGGVTIGDPNSSDPFSAALTTLGTGSSACGNTVSATCNGVFLKVLGTGAGGAKNSAPIGGGVASKTTVTVDNGGIATAGYVRAVGDCIGTIISPDKVCPGASVPTPAVPTSPLSSVPTVVTTMPTPTNPGKNCTFSPGTYISGKALSDANNACTGVSHFTPGKYYFDFTDGEPWEMKHTIIGGVRIGNSTSVPGACQSPIVVPNTAGVQFVFGGSSRVEVANGANVELCGPSNGGSAPLTIYQQQVNGSGTTVTPPPVTETITFGPESAGVVTNPVPVPNKFSLFVPQDGSANLTGSMLSAVDSQGARWTSGANGNEGELNLSGFASTIPAGATISAATVRVDLSTIPTFSPKPRLSLSGVDLGPISASGDFTLTPAQLTQLQSASPVAPTIKFTIAKSGNNPAKNSTFTIDRVALTATYTTTTTPPPVTVDLTKTTNTVFISSKANTTASFVVQGATYAPTGTIDIDAGQTAFIAFRWGLLAHGVGFKTYPQQLFGFPLVSIPGPGSGLGATVTVVDLKVFVCEGGGACDAGGAHALTARVMITDPPYANHPVQGVRRIKILSWADEY